MSGTIRERMDAHDPRLFGAYGLKQSKLASIIGGYSPFYHLTQSNCYILYYFECRAVGHKSVRGGQQLCNDMIPYKLMIAAYAPSLVDNGASYYEGLPLRPPALPDSDDDDCQDVVM